MVFIINYPVLLEAFCASATGLWFAQCLPNQTNYQQQFLSIAWIRSISKAAKQLTSFIQL